MITLYQKWGHSVCLWLYDACEGIPPDTIVKDASRILPRSSIFRYAGKPESSLVNQGIGSLSHWSDWFQLELLLREGGIYSQLDVTLLSDLDFSAEYIFLKDRSEFQTCFMKGPAGSHFFEKAIHKLRSKVNQETMPQCKWHDSMMTIGASVGESHLERYYMPDGIFQNGMGFSQIGAPETAKLVHWWNASISEMKDSPLAFSFYARLLKENKLWSPTWADIGRRFAHEAHLVPKRVRRRILRCQ